MANSPTIVAASLDDQKLKDSIEKMVASLNKGLEDMKKSTDSAVEYMQKSLQKLGNTKINSGGSADGGSTRRTKSQQTETQAVRDTTTARKEYNATLDQTAQAMQKLSGGGKMSIIETYDMQIELLKNRLRDVRQDIDVFYAAIGSGKKSQIEWGQQGLKEANIEAEKLMRQITALESQRANLANVVNPGHTFENYIKSLQQVNPELALLNQQFKSGNALLQQKNTSLRLSASEERKIAQESRERIQTELAYASTAAARERQRRDELRNSAYAAQDLSRELIRAMAAGEKGFSTENYNKLTEYYQQMRQAYFNLMSDAERESPLGRVLKYDIDVAEKALIALRKLGGAANQIKLVSPADDASMQTIETLRVKLKNLSDQYNKLTVAEINAGKGKGIAERFQRISREAQVLQKTLSTPVSFTAVSKIQVKTLDDMAYKLQQLNAYRNSIDLTKPDSAQKLKEVDVEIVRLKKDMDKYMASTKSAEMATNALTRSLNYMKNRLAFYFTVGASTAFVKNLIDIRAQYEMNERALGILINSAERGSQIFNELSQMALVSPYTLIELSSAAKQLTAYDIAAKDVVDTTRRLADMTAAVGIPIERLTYAIGQVKAYGYLNARDARMFSNAGIPLVKELADYYTQLEGRIVSVADVYDKIKKKAIDYNAVMSVVTKMTDEGGKFFNFQEKMAGTLKVQLANLTLAWNNMLNEIGSSQQGVLSTAIGGLKELFLQWKKIDKIIWTLIATFGIWKTIQLSTLLVTGNLTSAMAMQVIMGQKLQSKWASITASAKSSISGYGVAATAVLMLFGDALMTYYRNAEEVRALNKSIADGAKESAENLYKFLESAEISRNRLSAQNGKLPQSDAGKTWESLREQIELSSLSANEIIPKLLKIKDVNERLTAAFGVAEKIAEVNNQLSSMYDKLDITQNSILGGFFGEGLVEDIDDFNQRLKSVEESEKLLFESTGSLIGDVVQGLSALFNDVKESLGSSEKEAEKEIKNFAHNAAGVIRDELGEEGIRNSVKVNEAIARIVQGLEKQFPQIRGKGKALFETMFNDIMAEEFEGAVDKQAYYYKLFLERLKKDHSSAFQEVTDGILDDTHRWNTAQLDAIQKTADKVKEDLPEASRYAINQILQQLNSTQFKIRIVTEFAKTTEDKVTEQFRKQFIDQSFLEDQTEREKRETENLQKYGQLMKKAGESNLEYEDRVRKKREENLKISKDNDAIIKANAKKTDDASKAIVAQAKEEKKAADDFLESAKKVEEWGGYNFSTKKETSASKKERLTAEKEISEALKQELSVIKDMESSYDKLRKAGVDNMTAVDLAAQGYEDTLNRVNRTLAKYGISKFNAKDFLGKDVNSVLRTLEKQRSEALASGKLKSGTLKELDVRIKELRVEAKTYNLDKITKGLNSELDRLKDEYELAVELDANPELGDMFSEMFGIDTSDFPRTINEYMRRVQNDFDSAREQFGYTGASLNVFQADERSWKLWGQWVGLSGEALDKFKSKFVDAQSVAKKWAQDTVNQTKSLQYELADTNGKIAIEEEKLADLKKRLADETNEHQRELLELQIKRQEQSIEKLKEEVLQMLPAYKNLFNSIVEHSANTTRILAEQWKKALEGATRNPDGSYTITDPNGTDKATVGRKEYGNQIDKVNAKLRSTQSSMKKIKEAFTKGEDGVVDWAKGVELVGEELGKVASLAGTIGEIAEAFSNPNEYNATAEAIKDIAQSLNGAATVAQGIGQIASGDYIGGAASILSGAWTAVSGWLDNSDKAIQAEIKESEMAVKRLTIAYKELQYQIEKAYGAQEIGAKQTEISFKKLELEEVKRQLRLEKSRDSKHRDEERILSLQEQIIDLENEIKKATDDVTNNLLGITSVGDAMEGMVSKMIENLRYGKDAMTDFNDSIDEMVANMLLKFLETKYLTPILEEAWNKVSDSIQKRSQAEADALAAAQAESTKQRMADFNDFYGWIYPNIMDDESGVKDWVDRYKNEVGIDMREMWWATNGFVRDSEGILDSFVNWVMNKAQTESAAAAEEAKKVLDKVQTPTVDDLVTYADYLRQVAPETEPFIELVKQLLEDLDLMKDSEASSKLSALQQGIQGITEDTAGALEGITNGISQQSYLQSDLLTQIRDAVVSMDMDVQLGVFSQMLLQLQNNYIVMQSMQSMMENWTVPSGSGIRVELMS